MRFWREVRTRATAWSLRRFLVQAWQDWGEDKVRLLKDSDLSERQLNLALAYYREFKDEVDEAIAGNRRGLDQLASEYPFIESAVSGD